MNYYQPICFGMELYQNSVTIGIVIGNWYALHYGVGLSFELRERNKEVWTHNYTPEKKDSVLVAYWIGKGRFHIKFPWLNERAIVISACPLKFPNKACDEYNFISQLVEEYTFITDIGEIIEKLSELGSKCAAGYTEYIKTHSKTHFMCCAGSNYFEFYSRCYEGDTDTGNSRGQLMIFETFPIYHVSQDSITFNTDEALDCLMEQCSDFATI